MLVKIVEHPYTMRINLGRMRGITPGAVRALARVRIALNIPGIVKKAHLKKGEMIVIDNHRALHGRDNFECKYDGTQRWLQRVYLKWPK